MRTTLKRAIWLVPAMLLAACSGSEESDKTGTDVVDEAGRSPLVAFESSDVVSVDAPVAVAMSRGDLARATVKNSILGLHPAADFTIASEHDAEGLHHVRMNQSLMGLRVYGADVVVHMRDNAIEGVGGNVLGEVDTTAFNPTPAFEAQHALDVAKRDRLGSAPIETLREKTELVVWFDVYKTPRLAYHTEFFTEVSDLMKPGRWHHIIDAHTGRILRSWNALHSETVEQASGASGNGKFAHTWTNELDVTASGASYQESTSRLKTVTMKNATTGSGTVLTGALGSFTDASANDAHGYAEVTLNMLRDWQGYNSIDNAGFQILSRVHYSRSYENAFWDGTQMTYGDGAATFYPLSGAVDVCAHEIDHGFTEFHSALDYSGDAGGLNEGFSDLAGVTAAYYFNPSHASFNVGEDIFKSTGALRYMCDPTADGVSIDNAANMTASLDPHYSSGVMNKAFCRAAKRFSSGSATGTATAAGVHRASNAFFKANASYWTRSTTFQQGCQGVWDAAVALGFTDEEKQYLRASWIDVGVTCGSATGGGTDGGTSSSTSSSSGGSSGGTNNLPGCDETITTDSGTIKSPNYPSNYSNNYAHTWCIVPASGKSVTLTFSSFSTETNYDYVYLYKSDGTQVSKNSGTKIPTSLTSGAIAVKFTSDYSIVKKGFQASFTSK